MCIADQMTIPTIPTTTASPANICIFRKSGVYQGIGINTNSMSEIAVLSELESPLHQLDIIDEVAQVRAEEIVDASAETIQLAKAKVVVDIFDKLLNLYQKRRVGDAVYVGDLVVEEDIFATRTPDWRQLDEVFKRVTVYDPSSSRPMRQYRVEMLEGDDEKTVVELDPDGAMRFMRERGEQTRNLTLAEANSAMRDLVYRSELAVGVYQMRKDEATKQGLDPSLYSDSADMHTRHLLMHAGYTSQPLTSGE